MSIPALLETELKHASESIANYYGRFLSQYINIEPKLFDAMQYSLLNGGKRMRPLLVNLVGDALQISRDELTPIALAIECIHAYSLVHDDLPAMDDDALRRGKPTCHVKFDEATAILAGDALQSLAFEILASANFGAFASTKSTELVLALSRAAGASGMVGGQSMDLVATNQAISIDKLRQLHQLKTGAILKSCVNLPCLICKDLSSTEHETFLRFAENIGLAFQIQDDILDVIASTETLGKPQGSDADANKSTFVSLLGLDGAKSALNNHHKQALDALSLLSYNTEKLKVFSDFMVTRTY